MDLFLSIIGTAGSVCLGANVITANMDSVRNNQLAQLIMNILDFFSGNVGKNKNA